MDKEEFDEFDELFKIMKPAIERAAKNLQEAIDEELLKFILNRKEDQNDC